MNDPRGQPSDEDYIKNLEWFNEELRRQIIIDKRKHRAFKEATVRVLARIGRLANRLQ